MTERSRGDTRRSVREVADAIACSKTTAGAAVVMPEDRTMKILVADDEEMIRELVRATLVRDGHFEVELASNGDEAIAAVRAHNPELVILDVRMPETDGVEACRRIREECGPDRPTIFMLSAMGQDSDIERGMSAGADDYLTKPFSPRELLARLYELFEIAA